jgi:hypothetical protein
MAKGKQKKKKAKKARFQTPELSDNEFYEEEDEDNICRCICGYNHGFNVHAAMRGNTTSAWMSPSLTTSLATTTGASCVLRNCTWHF